MASRKLAPKKMLAPTPQFWQTHVKMWKPYKASPTGMKAEEKQEIGLSGSSVLYTSSVDTNVYILPA